MLHNHTTISSIKELTVGQKRYVLFNGQIKVAIIKEIVTQHSVTVEFELGGKKDFQCRLSIHAIYDQAPQWDEYGD